MISKKIPTVLFLFSLVISSSHLKAQNLELMNASLQLLNSVNSSCNCDCTETLNINSPFFEGQLILKDETVYNGKISINQPYQNKLITILNLDNNYVPIDNDLIKDVIFRRTENENETETKFTNLNSDDRLYRLIFQNESLVRVYDSSNELLDNSLAGRIIIEENNIITDTWNFWSSSPKKDVINYLNNRDNTNYKRRDFESLNDLFAKL